MNNPMFSPTFSRAFFRRNAKACLAITLTLVFSSALLAQTTRPGGSARGTTRTGLSTTTSRGGGAAYGNNGTARNYRSNTMLGDAIIQVDPESRSLVVITDEETHLELDKIVKNLDRPKPQVLIKVVFVEVTYNKGSDIGVEGSYTFNIENARAATTGSQTVNSTGTQTSNGTTTTTSSTLTTPLGTAATLAETLGANSLFGLAAENTGTFVRVVTDDWSATLRALATRGKVEVLSRPSIMARNNQEAVIVVGQEVPFITNSRTDALGQITNTIQYDNVGIILRVTPFITSDGAVEMIVAPEISTLTSQTVPISSTASAPVIAKRSAETVVVSPNGATVVIGGFM
jgi:general secretion pathway protein D